MSDDTQPPADVPAGDQTGANAPAPDSSASQAAASGNDAGSAGQPFYDQETAHVEPVAPPPPAPQAPEPAGYDQTGAYDQNAYVQPAAPEQAGYQQPQAQQPYAQQPYAQQPQAQQQPGAQQAYAQQQPYAQQPGSEQPVYTPYQYTAPIPPLPNTPAASGGSGGPAKKAVAAGVVAGVLAGLVAGVGGYALAESSGVTTVITGGESQSNPTDPKQLSPRADNSIAAIAKRMLPTVVSIAVKSGQSGATGSGFVIRSDGYIMTNNHVVRSAASGSGSVSVQFDNRTSLPAKVVGTSPAYDIAVLKVSKEGLSTATLGNSDSVAVGDAAIVIGSPLGLSGTVTSGIISSLRRPVTTGGEGETSFISALQTDAPINPGNSGGPLVNNESQVVGVASAIATLGSSSGGESGSIGLGFAIPINSAKRIGDEIIATGKAVVPIVGVQINMEYAGPGAQVKSVVTGGPAADQGIKAGDTIVAVNGEQIEDATQLLSTIRTFAPGQTITLTVATPGGGTKDVKVKLDGKAG